MKETENDYRISFFKPTTESARFNRGLVIWLASIWFVAIFGFQILLMVVGKPTPEVAYLEFENVWDNIQSDDASEIDFQQFGQVTLSVLGKLSVSENDRVMLANAMSWSVYNLIPDSIQSRFTERIGEFERMRSEVTDLKDPEYISKKNIIGQKLGNKLGLSELDVRTSIIPVEITTVNITSLSEELINNLPGIMKKYLIHNQSVLTDTIFLGFPFHYFYTAVFLLILFVGLCLMYCLRTDRRNALLGIKE